jgi:hypothetical protein
MAQRYVRAAATRETPVRSWVEPQQGMVTHKMYTDDAEFNEWYKTHAKEIILQIQRNGGPDDLYNVDEWTLAPLAHAAWKAGMHAGAQNPYC